MQENREFLELLKSQDTWFQFFDMIRVIEPGGTHRVLYYSGTEQFDVEKPCFDFWNREAHCANCVSKRACMEQTTVMKFEYRNSSYYLVLAKPVMHGDRQYILELVLNVTKQMLNDEENMQMKDFVLDIVDRLEHVSSKEAFTNLYNKPHMIDLYDQYKAAGRENLYMALLDIDNFKLVNDIYGHDLGDQAILKIAEVLSEQFSAIGTVARFGGDEFGIIFEDGDGEQIHNRLEQAKQKLDSLIYQSEDKKFHILISYGLANVSKTENFSDAVHTVDKELYYAKRNGIIEKTLVE